MTEKKFFPHVVKTRITCSNTWEQPTATTDLIKWLRENCGEPYVDWVTYGNHDYPNDYLIYVKFKDLGAATFTALVWS